MRDFQNKKKIKLLDFLFKNITSDWGETIDCSKTFVSDLSDSDSVVIILDGFDEIEFDEKLYDQLNFTYDMYSEESPQYFISGLLSGKMLPKAKKVITSRPRQMLELSPSLRPIFIVSIIGIDEKGQQQICEDICKNDKQTQLIWNYVQNQPELNSYCYVPIMAILIFHTIYQIFKSHKSNQQIPITITQVLVYNWCLFIDTNHVHINDIDHQYDPDPKKTKLESLSKLSKLAYKGIIEKQLYFSDDDFQTAGLNKNDISTFFNTFHANDTSSSISIVKKITKKLSYFSHLIWQEFFAAIHMIFHLEPEDLKKACSDFNLFDLSSSRFEVVTKFLFGLCNERTVESLRSIDKSYFSSPIDSNVLKQHLHSHLENINNFFKFERVLHLASLLYEFKNKNLTQELSNLLPSVLIIDGDVFPNNVLPFCELIRERQLDLELHLKTPRFYKNSHLLFFKEMEPITAKLLYIKVNIILLYCVSINQLESLL